MAEQNHQEVQEVNGVHAIQQVLHMVCGYLNGSDLKNLSEVCTEWRPTVLNEIKKRCYFLQLHITYKADDQPDNVHDIDDMDDMEDDYNFVDNTVYDISLVPILIYDLRLGKTLTLPRVDLSGEISNDLLKRILERVENLLLKKSIEFKTDRFLTTDDPEFQNAQERNNLEATYNSDILGLFRPTVQKRIQVHFASILPRRRDAIDGTRQIVFDEASFNHLTGELGLKDCKHSPSTIIMFTTKIDGPELVCEFGKRIIESGKRAKFICIFQKWEGYNHRHPTSMLRISGKSVESCSALIHVHEKRRHIERKLARLREQVKPNRQYIGLVYSFHCTRPSCDHIRHPSCVSEDMMHTLKRIFPYIRFVGFYLEDYIDNYYTNSGPLHPNVLNGTYGANLHDKYHLQMSLYFNTMIAIISWE